MSGPLTGSATPRQSSSLPTDDALLEGIQGATGDNPVLRECCERQRKQDEVGQATQGLSERLARGERVSEDEFQILKDKLSGLEKNLGDGSQTQDVRQALQELTVVNGRLDALVVTYGTQIQRDGSQGTLLAQVQEGLPVPTSRAEVTSNEVGAKVGEGKIWASVGEARLATEGARTERTAVSAVQERVRDAGTDRASLRQSEVMGRDLAGGGTVRDQREVSVQSRTQSEESGRPSSERKVERESENRVTELYSSKPSTGSSSVAVRTATEGASVASIRHTQRSDVGSSDQRPHSSQPLYSSKTGLGPTEPISASVYRGRAWSQEPTAKNESAGNGREAQASAAALRRPEARSTVIVGDPPRAPILGHPRSRGHVERSAPVERVREKSRLSDTSSVDWSSTRSNERGLSVNASISRTPKLKSPGRLESATSTVMRGRASSFGVASRGGGRQKGVLGSFNEGALLKWRLSTGAVDARSSRGHQPRGLTATDTRTRAEQGREQVLGGRRLDERKGGSSDKLAGQVLRQASRTPAVRLQEGLRLAKGLAQQRDFRERSSERHQRREGEPGVRSEKHQIQSRVELGGVVRSVQRTQAELMRLVRGALLPLVSSRSPVSVTSVNRQAHRLLERIKNQELRDVKAARMSDIVRGLRTKTGDRRLDRVNREAVRIVRQYFKNLERRLQQSMDPRSALYKRLTTELTVSDLERLISMLGGARAARRFRRKGRKGTTEVVDESDLTNAVLEDFADTVGVGGASGLGNDGGGSYVEQGGATPSGGGDVVSEGVGEEGGLIADGVTPKAELTTVLVRDTTSSFASDGSARHPHRQ